MAILVDWVKQAVSGTPGTGVITLGSAVSGYIRFQDDTRISDGTTVYYTIEDGANRERGIGTYASSGTTLTRTAIHAKIESGAYSENPGTGLNLSSAAVVSCSAIADTHNFRGCLLYPTSSQTLTPNTYNAIKYAAEAIDTDSFHDIATNNSRITIPSGKGISKVQLFGNLGLDNAGVSSEILVVILKNGAEAVGMPLYREYTGAGYYFCRNLSSGPVSVVGGDYFTLEAYPVATGKTTYYNASNPNYNWISLMVIE